MDPAHAQRLNMRQPQGRPSVIWSPGHEVLEAEYDADSDAYVLSTDEGAEVGELSRTVAEMLEGMTEYYVVYDGDVHMIILY